MSMKGSGMTMRTMRELFEAVSKKVGPDQYEFQGKKGHWRTVNGSELFFPDDGASPLGMPKAMKASGKKAAGKGSVSPSSVAGGAKYFDPQKSTLAASIRLSKKVSGAEAKKAVSELADTFHKAAGLLVANRDRLPEPNMDDDDIPQDKWDHEIAVREMTDKVLDGWASKWADKLGLDGDEFLDEWLEVHERTIRDRKH
jgi:hypothetical protein